MKIAYILARFPSISETFILREMLELEEQGVELLVFSLKRSKGGKTHPSARPLAARTRYRSPVFAPRTIGSLLYFTFRSPCRCVTVLLRLAGAYVSSPGMLLHVLRNFAAATEFAFSARRAGIEHIHAHFAFVPADVALAMSHLLGVAYSVSAHAWDIHTRPERALRHRLGDAGFVVVCSRKGQERIRNVLPDVPHERIVMLRHGLPLDSFSPAVPTGSMILGVGRLEEKKGFCYLVNACRILDDRGVVHTCVIAGAGRREQLLRKRISGYGLEDRVMLSGEIDENELRPLYEQASMFVLPSVVAADGDRDGIPNAVLEAMAMCLPVVTTTASACREIIEDGQNGFLVPPRDTEAIAERIERLLSDEALRRSMGRKARNSVFHEFDIASNVGELKRLFSASLRPSPGVMSHK